MCEKLACGREHVPPKCLFPQKTDIPNGKDYQRNLITVPSCNEHNLAKSKDDEYIAYVIAAHFRSNDIAQEFVPDKLERAFKRRQSLIGIFANNEPIGVGDEIIPAFHIDRYRFDNAMINIARGIHFHHFTEKYLGEVSIISSAFFELHGDDAKRTNSLLQRWAVQSTRLLNGYPKLGANPEIFYYQVVDTPGRPDKALRLVFYDGFVVDAKLGHS